MRWSFELWFIVLICALLIAGCRADHDRVDPGRDVILVVIDTLRADFVGVSGHAPYDATPNIDRLAKRGRWCTDAWSNAPWTPPSIMSIMTSLEPPAHGLEMSGDRLVHSIPQIPAHATTLAEVLRDSGYRTAAITAGGGAGRRYGFDRGFDEWYEPDQPPKTDVADGIDRAIERLRRMDDRPLFLYFHTYEVHLPNTHTVFRAEDDERSRAVAGYASDLAFADRHLGRLFDELEARQGLDSAIVVITADHGENLHDRDIGGRAVDHGHHLYAELIRVPLVVVAPELIPAAGRFAAPVQSLDILPTVASLLGVDLAGRTIQGRDLRPQLQGWGARLDAPPMYAWAPLQGPTWGAIRTAGWTHIEAPGVETDQWWGDVRVPPVSLHDRDRDPDERRNLVVERPQISAHLANQLATRRASNLDLRHSLGGSKIVTPDESDMLRALGYVDR